MPFYFSLQIFDAVEFGNKLYLIISVLITQCFTRNKILVTLFQKKIKNSIFKIFSHKIFNLRFLWNFKKETKITNAQNSAYDYYFKSLGDTIKVEIPEIIIYRWYDL